MPLGYTEVHLSMDLLRLHMNIINLVTKALAPDNLNPLIVIANIVT